MARKQQMLFVSWQLPEVFLCAQHTEVKLRLQCVRQIALDAKVSFHSCVMKSVLGTFLPMTSCRLWKCDWSVTNMWFFMSLSQVIARTDNCIITGSILSNRHVLWSEPSRAQVYLHWSGHNRGTAKKTVELIIYTVTESDLWSLWSLSFLWS